MTGAEPRDRRTNGKQGVRRRTTRAGRKSVKLSNRSFDKCKSAREMGDKAAKKGGGDANEKKGRSKSFPWPGDLEARFCELYEEYPSLWDTEDDYYYDKDKRQACLVEMSKSLKMPCKYFYKSKCP